MSRYTITINLDKPFKIACLHLPIEVESKPWNIPVFTEYGVPNPIRIVEDGGHHADVVVPDDGVYKFMLTPQREDDFCSQIIEVDTAAFDYSPPTWAHKS